MPEDAIVQNNRIFLITEGFPPGHLPIGIIKQGGPFLSEYEELRKKEDFFELYQNVEMIGNIMKDAVEKYDLDGVVVFNDISLIPKALGMEVEVKAGTGTILPKALTLENVHSLNKKGAIDRLKIVSEIIASANEKLQSSVPVIGFSESPWTLFNFMINGERQLSSEKCKHFLRSYRVESIKLLDLLTDVIINYLVMQVEAGVKILLVFDYSLVNKVNYMEFCYPYLKRIRESVREKLKQKELNQVPMMLFTRNARFCLQEQASLGYEVISTNWKAEPHVVRTLLSVKNVTVQENIDPSKASPELLSEAVKDLIKEFEPLRYVINLGHGMYADSDPEMIQPFIDIVNSIPHKCC